MPIKIEKATIADVIQIHKLVNSFAEHGVMLARPLSEIYETLRDFFVAREDGAVIACAAMHITWSDMAEVKSLAVTDDHHHCGIGEALVKACVDEARAFDIDSVFALTYAKSFFEKCGFKEEDKSTLPHKIWGECYRCPKFPDCDELAMVYRIKPKK